MGHSLQVTFQRGQKTSPKPTPLVFVLLIQFWAGGKKEEQIRVEEKRWRALGIGVGEGRVVAAHLPIEGHRPANEVQGARGRPYAFLGLDPFLSLSVTGYSSVFWWPSGRVIAIA